MHGDVMYYQYIKWWCCTETDLLEGKELLVESSYPGQQLQQCLVYKSILIGTIFEHKFTEFVKVSVEELLTHSTG